jgi:hypothetical protein
MSPRRRSTPPQEPSPLDKAQAEFDTQTAEDVSYNSVELQLAFAGLILAIDSELTAKRISEEAAIGLKLKAAQSILELAINNKDGATATQIGPTIDTLQHIDGMLKTKPMEPKKATRATRTTRQTTSGAKT